MSAATRAKANTSKFPSGTKTPRVSSFTVVKENPEARCDSSSNNLRSEMTSPPDDAPKVGNLVPTPPRQGTKVHSALITKKRGLDPFKGTSLGAKSAVKIANLDLGAENKWAPGRCDRERMFNDYDHNVVEVIHDKELYYFKRLFGPAVEHPYFAIIEAISSDLGRLMSDDTYVNVRVVVDADNNPIGTLSKGVRDWMPFSLLIRQNKVSTMSQHSEEFANACVVRHLLCDHDIEGAVSNIGCGTTDSGSPKLMAIDYNHYMWPRACDLTRMGSMYPSSAEEDRYAEKRKGSDGKALVEEIKRLPSCLARHKPGGVTDRSDSTEGASSAAINEEEVFRAYNQELQGNDMFKAAKFYTYSKVFLITNEMIDAIVGHHEDYDLANLAELNERTKKWLKERFSNIRDALITLPEFHDFVFKKSLDLKVKLPNRLKYWTDAIKLRIEEIDRAR